jgi:ubiquinol-cytochrome c reductase cytochrome c1 subunit
MLFGRARLTSETRYKWAPLKTRKLAYTPPQHKSILDGVSKPNNQGKTNL